MSIEHKFVGGHILNTKQEERNGIKIGIIEGYGATFDVDRGDYFGVKDQFVKGAFLNSINELRVKKRPVRMLNQHDRQIGGFPIEKVFEDDRGLFVVGEVNLEIQEGRETFALAKQGVLSDFSIGFSIDESSLDEQNELRTISKATIWEISTVTEPMNPKAIITAVKSINKFEDLPLAAKDVEWNKEKALLRIESLSDDEISKAFISTEEKTHGIQIADVVKGKLVVIPEAIIEAAEYVKNNELEEKFLTSAINSLEKYFAKMNIKSPFEDEIKQFFRISEVKLFTQRDLEKSLIKSGLFSKDAAKYIVSQTNFEKEININEDNQQIIDELSYIKELIKKK